MANLKDVIYLSAEDYNTLYTNGTVTINGVTLTYDANNVYIVPDNTQEQIDDILAKIPSNASSSNKMLTADDISEWAKASTKPSYNFSEIGSKPTTIDGYGITDAKIESGTITLGSNTITPLTGFTETDPTVPSWAKQSTKPSYNYSEIGNTPSVMTITKVTGNNIDLNTYKETGIYLGEYNAYNTLLNKPNVNDFNAGFVLFVIKFGGGYSCQFFMCYGTNGSLYSRTMYYTNGSYVFTSWTTT